MKQIRVVVADDEPLARKTLCGLLAAHPEAIVVGEAGTVGEAARVLADEQPDAIFLDIQMPGGTGFDVLSDFVQPIQVVFVTAYDEYAVRAFQINAIDYLVKPVDPELLAGAVARLSANHPFTFDAGNDARPRPLPFCIDDDLLVKKNGRCSLIPLLTVCAIRACQNYTEAIDAQNQIYLFRWPMKDWHNRLPTPPFLRLDRSLIINSGMVSAWEPTCGRRTALVFKNLKVKLILGRAASERFKNFADNVFAAKNNFQPDPYPDKR